MARWKLMQKHYIKVPGTTWEYRETGNTGRQVRKVLEVPMYLDPDDPADQNYKADGLIIIAHSEDDRYPKDIIFIGDPTPDMIPLDTEAKEITARFQEAWGKPAVDIGEEGFTGALLNSLTETLQAFNASAKPSGFGVDEVKFNQLMEMNASLMEMNKMLLAKLEPARRV